MVDIVNIEFRTRGARETDEAIRRLQGSSSAATTATDLLRRALITLGGALSVREFVRLSDTYNQISARLKLVTSGTRELNTVQQALFNISQENRVSFESTAELYQRLARSADQLGLNQGTLLNVTEAVNQAIQVSGVSSEAANAAIVQLGQGLASGALRGDELRSVLEQVPRLAQAIADGIGVTVGELRELGAEGALTSEAVIGAIRSQAPQLASEFEQIPATFGSALSTLRNSFTLFVGRIEETSGVVGGLTQTVLDFADTLASQQTFDTLVSVFRVWALTANDVSDNIRGLVGSVDSLQDRGDSLASTIGRTFIAIPATVQAATEAAAVQIASFIEGASASFQAFGGFVEVARGLLTFDREQADAGREQIRIARERIAANSDLRDSTIDSIFAEREARVAAFDEQLEQAAQLRLQAEIDQARIEELRAQDLENRQLTFEAQQEQFTNAEERRLERIQESLLTERELAEQNFEEELKLLERGVAAGKATQAQIQRLEKAHQRNLTRIDKEGLTARQRFEQASLANRAQNVAQFLQSTLSGVSNTNRTLFRIQKAAAITEAIINGIRGVQQALAAYPPPINFALAALVGAAAIANVQRIRSTQFGSGVAPSAAPGGPGSAPDTPLFTRGAETGADGGITDLTEAPTATAVTSTELSGGGGPAIEIVVEPGIRDQGAIVQLITQINEALGDGATLAQARTR